MLFLTWYSYISLGADNYPLLKYLTWNISLIEISLLGTGLIEISHLILPTGFFPGSEDLTVI